MSEDKNIIHLNYQVDGKDFSLAGEASSTLKKKLKRLGIKPEIIRKISIAMYEAEMNMVLHAGGGKADVEITPSKVKIILKDQGPGIPDIDLAMKEGYSTAPDSIRELGFGAGMGLPNIKNYTDKLQIFSQEGKGTKVEITVYIN